MVEVFWYGLAKNRFPSPLLVHLNLMRKNDRGGRRTQNSAAAQKGSVPSGFLFFDWNPGALRSQVWPAPAFHLRIGARGAIGDVRCRMSLHFRLELSSCLGAAVERLRQDRRRMCLTYACVCAIFASRQFIVYPIHFRRWPKCVTYACIIKDFSSIFSKLGI